MRWGPEGGQHPPLHHWHQLPVWTADRGQAQPGPWVNSAFTQSNARWQLWEQWKQFFGLNRSVSGDATAEKNSTEAPIVENATVHDVYPKRGTTQCLQLLNTQASPDHDPQFCPNSSQRLDNAVLQHDDRWRIGHIDVVLQHIESAHLKTEECEILLVCPYRQMWKTPNTWVWTTFQNFSAVLGQQHWTDRRHPPHHVCK